MLQGVPFRVTWRARLCAVQGNRRVARADRRPDVPSHEDNPTCTLHKAFAIGLLTGALLGSFGRKESGRASCRERVCQYVNLSVVAVSLKKTNKQHDKEEQARS